METGSGQSPLVVIVGQTASGKSDLAIKLARHFNGEIVAADSRTVYLGLDIGTAKPTADEQKLVKHHLIDVVDPTTTFSAANFKQLANMAIADVAARGRLPILVGGTGLYVDAVIYDFQFRPPADPNLRRELERLDVAALQNRLRERGVPLPANSQNPRHLIRALETGGAIAARRPLRANTLVLGLMLDPDVLHSRIIKRVDSMVERGLIDEVRDMADRYGWDAPGLQAPAYKAFRLYFEGAISLEDAKKRFVQYDWQYARRQKTWFKRNKDIVWIGKPEEAVGLVTTLLNK